MENGQSRILPMRKANGDIGRDQVVDTEFDPQGGVGPDQGIDSSEVGILAVGANLAATSHDPRP
jgi:hypothetical protein